MQPLVFEPTYVHPIWAGDAIARARGIEADARRNFGEAFDVSSHPDVAVTIANGPLAGMKLDEAIRTHHDEIIGDLPDEDVLAITFMDARENLSIQVHPNEEDAQRLDGDHGKTESWYILSAEPGATLIGGSSTNDREALREATKNDTIGERYGRRVPVSEGDFVFVPAGTLHALGAGVFAVEVGTFGNRTYRMCDWGRGRELHVEKAFQVVDTASMPSVVSCGTYGPEDGVTVRRGVDCELFRVNVVDVAESWHVELAGRYQIITCVKGSGTVSTSDGTVELPYTGSVLIPAAAGSFTVTGACRVLQSYRPAPDAVTAPSR